jgi:hypothetical protein
MHVPAVEADPTVGDLFAETRVRGLSDKCWNVLSQNVDFVAKFAGDCTPKMARISRSHLSLRARQGQKIQSGMGLPHSKTWRGPLCLEKRVSVWECGDGQTGSVPMPLWRALAIHRQVRIHRGLLFDRF